MPNKTPDYQIKAVKKYQEKFKEIRFRVLPEDQEMIIAHAKAMGDKSTSAFLIRAVKETIERDLSKRDS
jgi:uncharacterized protein (DUF1778 family)